MALRQFTVTENNEMYLGLHVKCPTVLPDFNQILILLTDFHKDANFKFLSNSYSGSCIDTCKQVDTTRLTGTFYD